MEIPGPCDICGEHTMLHTCTQCGRKVCKGHWVDEGHACTVCAKRPPTPRSLEKEPGQIPKRPEGDVPEEGTGRYT